MHWHPEAFASATLWDINDAYDGWAEANGLKKSPANIKPLTKKEKEIIDEIKRLVPDKPLRKAG